jgi:hypothetical protein
MWGKKDELALPFMASCQQSASALLVCALRTVPKRTIRQDTDFAPSCMDNTERVEDNKRHLGFLPGTILLLRQGTGGLPERKSKCSRIALFLYYTQRG